MIENTSKALHLVTPETGLDGNSVPFYVPHLIIVDTFIRLFPHLPVSCVYIASIVSDSVALKRFCRPAFSDMTITPVTRCPWFHFCEPL
jgi:hypothetical protein